MKKAFTLVIAIILLVSLLGACGGGGSGGSGGGDDKLIIGVSIRGLEDPYFVQVKDGAELFAEAMVPGNYEISLLDCQSSDDKQINDIKAFLARVDPKNAILYVDPNNAPVASVVADLCEEAGVYWNTTWSYADGVYPMDYKYYIMHQTADDELGGYEAARGMFEKFSTPGSGKICAVLGMLANDASIDRGKGLEKALAEYPNVELLDIQTANWNSTISHELALTWVARYGDELDGIWVADDSMALGVTEALRAKGLNGKIIVTGFDCIDEVIPAIEAGDIYVTYAANPYLQAGFGLAYSYAALTGAIDVETFPIEKRMIYTKGYVVTSDNVAEYKRDYVDSHPVYDYTDLDSCILRLMDLNDLS